MLLFQTFVVGEPSGAYNYDAGKVDATIFEEYKTKIHRLECLVRDMKPIVG